MSETCIQTPTSTLETFFLRMFRSSSVKELIAFKRILTQVLHEKLSP